MTGEIKGAKSLSAGYYGCPDKKVRFPNLISVTEMRRVREKW